MLTVIKKSNLTFYTDLQPVYLQCSPTRQFSTIFTSWKAIRCQSQCLLQRVVLYNKHIGYFCICRSLTSSPIQYWPLKAYAPQHTAVPAGTTLPYAREETRTGLFLLLRVFRGRTPDPLLVDGDCSLAGPLDDCRPVAATLSCPEPGHRRLLLAIAAHRLSTVAPRYCRSRSLCTNFGVLRGPRCTRSRTSHRTLPT